MTTSNNDENSTIVYLKDQTFIPDFVRVSDGVVHFCNDEMDSTCYTLRCKRMFNSVDFAVKAGCTVPLKFSTAGRFEITNPNNGLMKCLVEVDISPNVGEDLDKCYHNKDDYEVCGHGEAQKYDDDLSTGSSDWDGVTYHLSQTKLKANISSSGYKLAQGDISEKVGFLPTTLSPDVPMGSLKKGSRKIKRPFKRQQHKWNSQSNSDSDSSEDSSRTDDMDFYMRREHIRSSSKSIIPAESVPQKNSLSKMRGNHAKCPSSSSPTILSSTQFHFTTFTSNLQDTPNNPQREKLEYLAYINPYEYCNRGRRSKSLQFAYDSGDAKQLKKYGRSMKKRKRFPYRYNIMNNSLFPSRPSPSQCRDFETVTIGDYDFSCRNIVIPVSTSVKFQLRQDVPIHVEHVLEGRSLQEDLCFVSPILQHPDCPSYVVTPTVPGEIFVRCQIYSDMTCRIVVLPAEYTSACSMGVKFGPPITTPPRFAQRHKVVNDSITGLAEAYTDKLSSPHASVGSFADSDTISCYSASTAIDSDDGTLHSNSVVSTPGRSPHPIFYDDDDQKDSEEKDYIRVNDAFYSPANEIFSRSVFGHDSSMLPTSESLGQYDADDEDMGAGNSAKCNIDAVDPDVTIFVEDFRFQPSNISVELGSRVRFVCSGLASSHKLNCLQVAPETGASGSTDIEFENVTLNGGSSSEKEFVHQFENVGSYLVANEIFSFMHCNIDVTAPQVAIPEAGRQTHNIGDRDHYLKAYDYSSSFSDTSSSSSVCSDIPQAGEDFEAASPQITDPKVLLDSSIPLLGSFVRNLKQLPVTTEMQANPESDKCADEKMNSFPLSPEINRNTITAGTDFAEDVDDSDEGSIEPVTVQQTATSDVGFCNTKDKGSQCPNNANSMTHSSPLYSENNENARSGTDKALSQKAIERKRLKSQRKKKNAKLRNRLKEATGIVECEQSAGIEEDAAFSQSISETSTVVAQQCDSARVESIESAVESGSETIAKVVVDDLKDQKGQRSFKINADYNDISDSRAGNLGIDTANGNDKGASDLQFDHEAEGSRSKPCTEAAREVAVEEHSDSQRIASVSLSRKPDRLMELLHVAAASQCNRNASHRRRESVTSDSTRKKKYKPFQDMPHERSVEKDIENYFSQKVQRLSKVISSRKRGTALLGKDIPVIRLKKL